MNIAFYAPMKAPTHPTPSGDREIARSLIKALECSGHRVEVVSDFRSWEGRGDAEQQQRIAAEGEAERARCLARLSSPPATRPDAWFTYHVHHKTPDYLGPEISAELGIPYLIAEASHAPKQAGGCWRIGYERALQCIRKAGALLALNSADMEGLHLALRSISAAATRITRVKPFLVNMPPRYSEKDRAQSRAALAAEHGLDLERPWLITVAMMRSGDKLCSYKLLAQALSDLHELDWQLLVIGDGDARAEVEAHYAPILDQGRVVFLGQLEHAAIIHTMGAADLFVWPAVREALGMAMLEAQCCGLPVVAEQNGGVGDIVQHGETGLLAPYDHRHLGFTRELRRMLEQPEEWPRMRENALRRGRSHHSLGSAAWALNDCLTRVAKPGQRR